jgi:hypothetical protein
MPVRPAYVTDDAQIIGDVVLAAESSVWFGAVLRGDTERITVGIGSNIQDGAILHADPGFPCTVGAGVVAGHGAILHGCQIGDNCLIPQRRHDRHGIDRRRRGGGARGQGISSRLADHGGAGEGDARSHGGGSGADRRGRAALSGAGADLSK